MRVSLTCHPDTPCKAITAIEVEVERRGEQLDLAYHLVGNIAAVRLPAPATPERTDELWRHTCLEAFVRQDGQDGYFEINLSPSFQWAAYRFDRYRDGMAEADVSLAVVTRLTPEGMALNADVTLADLRARSCTAALTAVIEEKTGAKSYWSLAHPPGKPDFHHPDGFILDLK